MSYNISRFHKPGDQPFVFPPEGIQPEINANIIEIEGDNGTGKTTFLNCIALAFGYLDERKELGEKKRLVQRLQSLSNNESLSYYFKITGPLRSIPTISARRSEGENTIYQKDSNTTDLFDISKDFEVIFLADDDPRKDVKNSLTMISSHLQEHKEHLNYLTTAIMRQLQSISSYNAYKDKEKKYVAEIEAGTQKIKTFDSKISQLKSSIELVKERDSTQKKIELLNDRDNIISKWEELDNLYNKLQSSEEQDLIHKIAVARRNMLRFQEDEKESELKANIMLRKLKASGIILDGSRLLSGDFSELTQAADENQKIEDDDDQLQMIDDMVALFNRHRGDEIVPYFGKTVEESLDGLSQERRKRPKFNMQNQVCDFLTSLNKEAAAYIYCQEQVGKYQDKVTELNKKIKDLDKFNDIQKQHDEYETKYLELKQAENESSKLTNAWKRLSTVKGVAELLENELRETEISRSSEEKLNGRAEQNLAHHRESDYKKPKNFEKGSQLEQLSEEVLALTTKLSQWTSILQRDYSQFGEKTLGSKGPKPKLADEDVFIIAVGDFIGSSFEPVDYNHQKWNIRSYNLRTQAFITKDDREIDLDELSRGQTRKLTLVKILKEMKPEQKKKILLVDEIADLDANNLEWIRQTLKEKLSEGSLMLAVMVRPMTEKGQNMISLRGIT